MIKTLLPSSFLALALAISAPLAKAEVVSYSYAYTGSSTPGWNANGPWAPDNLHSETTTWGEGPTGFDSTGDLNDGVVGSEVFDVIPTGVPSSTLILFGGHATLGGFNVPTQITFDFGSAIDLTEVKIGSYVYPQHQDAGPEDVSISFSADNSTYTAPTE